MLTLKKVAITGGLSSGKTSVCELLKKRGAYCVSADEIVHQLLTPKSKIGLKIIELLGDEIVKGDQFDREKIAKIAFGEKQTLEALENLLHPAVLDEIEQQYQKIKEHAQYTLFIAEIPLLYEIEKEHLFDAVIAVVADPNIAKKRYKEKTKQSTEEFEMRMTHQLPIEEKKAKANYTLHNNGDLNQLEKQVETLHQNLTK